MSSDVGDSLALLLHIDKPPRSNVRRAGHQIEDMMNTFNIDRRISLAALDYFTENSRSIDQLFLENRRDLVTLCHNVIGNKFSGICLIESGFELGKIFPSDYPWFVD